MGKQRLWAPHASSVELVLYPRASRVPMHAIEGSHFEVEHDCIHPGASYAFSLDGAPPLPDPRSALQEDGVHGPSTWIDTASFEWTDQSFEQRPLQSAVLYEVHVGTFTKEGTFDAIVAHLPRLSALGITHIELMPVAHFPGNRGWGYDGVCLYAPHTAYGGPQGLARLVDACHRHGLAVVLDVVYNHLGPDGNYLARFGPYFTDRYKTPWGDALNFDGPGAEGVRRFVCDNACYWLEHYHIDALRLDATHAMFDASAVHILSQMQAEIEQLSARLGRPLYLIAEACRNQPHIVMRPESGGYGLASQWCNDLHHAIHAVLTKERAGYYQDFGDLAHVARTLEQGFYFQGQHSAYRGQSLGAPPTGLKGRQLVSFLQNHDQVGNRPQGDRLSRTLTVGQLKLGAALTLLAPFVPLLFMGEEWGCQRPFYYFTDHEALGLGEAIREGRQREFKAFGWTDTTTVPPQELHTFENSRLDWEERDTPQGQELEGWYRSLMQLRHNHPSLQDDSLEGTVVRYDEGNLWLWMQRDRLFVACNLSSSPKQLSLPQGQTYAVIQLSSNTAAALSGNTLLLDSHGVAILETDSRPH